MEKFGEKSAKEIKQASLLTHVFDYLRMVFFEDISESKANFTFSQNYQSPLWKKVNDVN